MNSRIGTDMARDTLAALLSFVLLGTFGFLGLGGSLVDAYQWSLRLRTAAPAEHTALVTIDEQALRMWNPEDPSPEITPRGLLAQVVRALDLAGAKVVVLDMLMAESSQEDVRLATAATAHGTVLVAERYVPSASRATLPFVQATTADLDGLEPGLANLSMAASTFFSEVLLVRGAPLLTEVHRARYRGRWPLSLTGEGSGQTLEMPALALLAAARTVDMDPTELPRVPVSGVVRIPFRGRAAVDGIPTVTASRLLGVLGQQELVASLGGVVTAELPADLAADLVGRAVLVCRVDGEGQDRFSTPLGLPLANHADMSGCRIQAHLVEGLASGELVRVRGRVLGWLLVPLVVLAVIRTRDWGTDRRYVGAWVGSAGLTFMLAVALFHLTGGVALALGPPLFAVLLTTFGVLVRGRSA